MQFIQIKSIIAKWPLKSILKRSAMVLGCLCALCLLIAAMITLYYFKIYQETMAHIERGVIDNVIFSESPVYYDDNQSVAGVFFDKTHRKYIKYENIPPYFIQALVAAEDKDFFTHHGFSFKSIFRAMWANLKSGRVSQGGSTLTQQTAKNIFKREKRSYQAKIKELMQALLLEKKYTKQEILEMYANQFFVTGFGNGLRIAAQYFFNKKAEELDLVEAAFIAGSVKGPYKYNPFIKKTEEEKNEARRQAKERKNYVIQNMYRLNYITREEYEAAKAREIPFQEGKVTFGLNVLLDFIREQLESDYFKTILQEQGINNVSTSGIKIYTSVNKQIQEGALESVRARLPLMDTKLSGYSREAVQKRYQDVLTGALSGSETDFPLLAKITSITSDSQNPVLQVTWQNGSGVVFYDGLQALGEAWLKWKLGNWAVFDKRHVTDFLKNFQPGDLVFVRPQAALAAGENNPLLLSKIPEIDGGLVVLQNGMIKAMVGGFFDRFFNRAVDAKRQLGSIFKPLVYTAALQLKWNSLDALVNRREIFPFEKTFYMPNPDHEPASDKVSMIWAGVKSENIATVWLLYHLSDYLTSDEFAQIVELVGLNRNADEPYLQYAARIRDKHGVVVDDDAMNEAVFEEAKRELETDLIFNGLEEYWLPLRNIHYKLTASEKKADKLPLVFQGGFQDLVNLNAELKNRQASLVQSAAQYREAQTPEKLQSIVNDLQFFYLLQKEGEPLKALFVSSRYPIDSKTMQPVTPERFLENEALVRNALLNGLMPSEVVDLVQENMQETQKKISAFKRYDPEILYKLKNFRVLVHLAYVQRLAQTLGISTELEPVLSFPLGANAISITEAALAYQAIMSGKVYDMEMARNLSMVPVITRIEDREGEIIWEYQPKPKVVLSERVCLLVSEILRMVMVAGTGQAAKNDVVLSTDIEDVKLDFDLPSFGKTGTANRYTNSSFIGFIPGIGANAESFNLRNGYVIASYVGYDDNRPMQSAHNVIYGASGAMPLWLDTVNIILNNPDYKQSLAVADLAFGVDLFSDWQKQGLQRVAVSSLTGLPARMEASGTTVAMHQVFVDAEKDDDNIVKKRVFEPMQGVSNAN